MKALTVQQPWASVIASGDKLVENRSWPTKYRGPLAIHTARRWSDRGAADPRIADWHGQRMLPLTPEPIHPTPNPVLFPLGLVIATAEIEDCHPAAWCCSPWGEHEYAEADGKVRHTVFHWVLTDVVPVTPAVPMLGRLGLWSIDLEEQAG